MRFLHVKLVDFELYISELQCGKFVLTYERHGREPRVCALNEEDFEDNAEIIDNDAEDKLASGTLASAVGLEFCLMKNEGVLKVSFKGKTGGIAEWTFNDSVTQTDMDIVRASTLAIHTGTMTETLDGHTQATNSVYHSKLDKSTQQRDLKRKAQATEPVETQCHRRAKSTHDGPPWPRHLYMTCHRTFPIFKGEKGTLHIDLKHCTAWFEGWYGRDHMRVFERKQLDLWDAGTIVAYRHYDNVPRDARKRVFDSATHCLKLSRPNCKEESTCIFQADCAAPDWKMSGSRRYSINYQTTSTHMEEHPITDPSIIVDALVHCIDRASGRQAIHDPDAFHKFGRDSVKLYHEQEHQRGGAHTWQAWIKRLKKREMLRKELRVIEEEDPEGSSSEISDAVRPIGRRRSRWQRRSTSVAAGYLVN
ncbi:Nn.00g034410.m01.CDS01 [Neocucurbitaria sp. VM-36]